MSKTKKQKRLVRRKNGNFAPNEVSILGAKCSIISNLIYNSSKLLSSYRLAYFDASHSKDTKLNALSEFTFHHNGNLTVKTTATVNEYAQRIQFSQFDFVFINGNHYAGNQQIVLLDPEKEASINKRINQITDIQFFIRLTENIDPFDSIKEKFENWRMLPSFHIDETDKIQEHITQLVSKTIPSLKGLVLAGGKSTRMGADKTLIDYHGKPQKQFVKELLENEQIETFYSTRFSLNQPNKNAEPIAFKREVVDSGSFADCCPSDFIDPNDIIPHEPDEIPDAFINLGPFGGICSAFQKDPNSAWFVLATDVPFVNTEIIQLLLQKRNPSKVATAVKGKNKKFVEPLITIYEPKAYPILLQYLAQGYSCPRKMLINSDVEIVEVDDNFIRNINTPEDFKVAKKEIAK